MMATTARKNDPGRVILDMTAIQEVGGFPSRFHTGNKTAVLLHIFSHLRGIHGDGSIEIGKKDDQHGSGKVVPESHRIAEYCCKT